MRDRTPTIAMTVLLVLSMAGAAACAVSSQGSQKTIRDVGILSRQELELAINQWPARDGEIAFLISDRFCDFAIDRPALFLEVMSEHPRVFDEWLAEVKDLSFVDFGGCVNPECVRTAMLRALERQPNGDRASSMRERLLETLRSVRVRKVE